MMCWFPDKNIDSASGRDLIGKVATVLRVLTCSMVSLDVLENALVMLELLRIRDTTLCDSPRKLRKEVDCRA